MAEGGENNRPDREIRLALVLNGGVSLAVWMGGVAHEIDELRRSSWQFAGEPPSAFSATHDAYTALLRALGTGLRVDLIAGSSAGGINGAALGAAIGAGKPLRVEAGKPLRDLWVSVGDFTELLRPVSDAQPPSVLRGDDYMLPHIQAAFTAILGTGPAVPTLPDPPASTDTDGVVAALAAERADACTIRLFITSTAFRGNVREYKDALGTAFNILDSRLRFRIVRDRWLRRDDFTRTDVSLAEILGRAARASASFPVAFEPTLLQKHAVPDDMIVLDQDTYAMDGGVLDNEPFDPVLDQLTQMPADDHVARTLVYIVPYPNDSRVPPPKPGEKPVMPNLREVLTNVASLPRDEGIDRDFDRLENLRALVQIREDAHGTLVGYEDAGALSALASALQGKQQAYRGLAAAAEAERLGRAPGARLGPNGGPESVYQSYPSLPGWGETPEAEPPAIADLVASPTWDAGFAAAERLSLRALAALRRALAGDPDLPVGDPASVRPARAVVSRATAEIRNLSFAHAATLRAAAGGLDSDVPDAAGYAAPLRPIIDAITAQLEAVFADRTADEWLTRLLEIEVIAQSLPSSLARGAPPFGVVRLSSDCGNALDIDRTTPAAKLAGLQLGHFGGFLKKSWRVNDWIWGRLDGAWHLIRLLLDVDESRLAEIKAENPAFVSELGLIAFPDGQPEMCSVLITLWSSDLEHDDVAGARRQFAAAFGAGPDGRERCTRAIIARAQLGIVTEEVPVLGCEAQADRTAGWRTDTIAPSCPKRGEPPITPEQARTQFDAWDGARELVSQETSTRAFARLVAQAAVVFASLLAGSRAALPGAIRVPFVWLRGVALGAYLFVWSWFVKPVAGLIVAIMIATAAVVTVLISSTLTAVTVPVAIGVVVAASALLLGHGRSAWRGFWTGVAVAAALVSCVVLSHHTQGTYPWRGTDSLAAATGLGLAVGFAAEVVVPRWRLVVFLVGLLVTAAALACLRSSGPLLDWIGGAVSDHWPLGLLSLSIAVPLAFGMAALAAAMSKVPPKPP